MKTVMTFLFLVQLGYPAFAMENLTTTSPKVPRTDLRIVSPLRAGWEFQYTPVRFPNYGFITNETTTKSGNGLRTTLEWIPFGDSPYGKLGVGGGVGFSQVTQVALSSGASGQISAAPFDLFLSYRFDIFQDQFLVPYVKAGLNRTLVKEVGQNYEVPGFQTYDGAEFTLGVLFNMGAIDPLSANELDHEIGINRTYLSVEYLNSRPLTASVTPNLGREEFRFGVRFEM